MVFNQKGIAGGNSFFESLGKKFDGSGKSKYITSNLSI